MHRWIISLVAAVGLAGCATSYQQMGDQGGYLQRQLGSDQYLVSFHANRYTGYDRARDFALLRAAEIGEKLGYAYFSVDGRGDESQTAAESLPATSVTTASTDSSGHEVTAVTTAVATSYPVMSPGVDLWVHYYAQKPGGRFLELYEVSQTASALRAKYEIHG